MVHYDFHHGVVYSYLKQVIKEKGAVFLALIDPDTDKIKSNQLATEVKDICESGADAILVGGSIVGRADFDGFLKFIKSYSKVPVIIFPGDCTHLSKYADAVLFISLISGRNPEYLIGEQVKASPIIKELGLEVIPTGYLLIESGNLTSALFMSHSFPIPRDKPDIAKYHALAGQYLGMKFIYLDAGSGAQELVPDEMIREVKDYISIPILVGGGIKNPQEAKSKVKAGAQGIVIGNILQENPDLAKDFANAIHKK